MLSSDVLIQSLTPFLDGSILTLLILGIAIGAIVGILPGIGAIVGMALVLPFTFDMNAFEAIGLLLAIYALTTITGDLTAILVGVPGSPSSAALVLDGYGLTKRGEAGLALGAVVGSSAMGAVLGALVLLAMIPFIRPIVLAIGRPQIFMLTLIGIVMVGSLSGRSPLKGVTTGLLGFLVAATGFDSQTGISRYSFGTDYLLDGVPLIPLAVGMFAIPEIIDLHRTKRVAGTSGDYDASLALSPRAGVIEALKRPGLILQSSLIGVIVGAIPGLGGAVAQWMAYGYAAQTTKEPSTFGKHNIDGVVAPGAANNSKEGGGLIPTIAFGIPGTAAMAVLLGAFMIVGVQPGPDMVGKNLDLTLFMVWVLVFANVVGAALAFLVLRPLARLSFVRGTLLVPFILLLVFLGAAANSGRIQDVLVATLVGATSFFLRRYGWPIVPILLGYVLGRTTETSLWISYKIHGASFLLQPSVLILAAAAVLLVWLTGRRLANVDVEVATAPNSDVEPMESLDNQLNEKRKETLVVELAFVLIGVVAVVNAQSWPLAARLFPVLMGSMLIALAIAGALQTTVKRRAVGGVQLASVAKGEQRTQSEIRDAIQQVPLKLGQSPELRMGVWIATFFVLTYFVGLVLGFAVFATLYLIVEDKMGILKAVAIAGFSALLTHGVFVGVLGMRLPRAAFGIF